MFQIVSKLRLLKDLLKELNRNMGNVFEEVARARSQLEDFQRNGPPVGDRLVALDEDRLKADYRRALRTEIASARGSQQFSRVHDGTQHRQQSDKTQIAHKASSQTPAAIRSSSSALTIQVLNPHKQETKQPDKAINIQIPKTKGLWPSPK
ncbi:hypothetical protein Nepgr_033559 [Nepenthes gracilis]|uniref:Uncharacterized protein n=1 Tax=Nepenthes gracilis TaxID=150966 RepID=A0AAD3TKN9_NEPGR|nr:hypothetical protein Nepgr_033559 [Nepenthes gracilis]